MNTTLARMALLFLIVPASASAYIPNDLSCDATIRTLSMSSMIVAGVPTKVAGPVNNREMLAHLARCRPEAVLTFRKWRARRKLVNVTAGAGVFFSVMWCTTAFVGIDAGVQRRQLDVMLSTPPTP